MNTSFHIIPYSPGFEPALLDLERKSVQGTWVRMEMVRDHFLSRSVVFNNFKVFLAMAPGGELAGVTAGAIVPFQWNDHRLKVGVGYDLKVAPAYRRQGLSKQLGKYLVEQYFLTEGAPHFFVTMKTSNIAVAKAAYAVKREMYPYEFRYLTLPTWKRVKKEGRCMGDLRFKTSLFPNDRDLSDYCIKWESGMGVWKTWKMYQLRLRRLHPLVKAGQILGNLFLPAYRQIPGEGALLRFATLFDFDQSGFFQMNEVLEWLQQEKIQYLNICCQKGDPVWKALKPLAINAYPYTLMGTFEPGRKDRITVDVRCL